MKMSLRVLAISGGVGGAKLAAGLANVIGSSLSVVVNTGDDFDHMGLKISPDLDSVIYRVAGMNDTVRGWGRRDETWNFMSALRQIGGEDWFQLGDRDLAMHVFRSFEMSQGAKLSEVTSKISKALGITAKIVPMTDSPVATHVCTDQGLLSFQDYFVAKQCRPRLQSVAFAGAESAIAAKELLEKDYDAIILCPSNPFVSIDPVLSLPGVRQALATRTCPAVAVSPFIGGRAIKGPAEKMCRELGRTPGPEILLEHYQGLIDYLVIDRTDASEDIEQSQGIQLITDDIFMRTSADADRLAISLLKQLKVGKVV